MAVFALEHKRIVLNIYNSSNRSVYELYLMKVCGSVVENYLHTVFGDVQADPESREILVRFYKCECFGQIIDWLNCAMNYNVCDQFSKLCRLREGFVEILVEELKQPVMLAPLVEEKDGESKQQETEGLVEDNVEEVREETVVLLLSEKEECSCASDDK